MTTGCLFCRIVAGELPSRTVYEDADCVAFLDIPPWHRGHTLVVPRRHVPDALSDATVLASLSPAIVATGTLLVRRLGADGMTVLSSVGAAAGQEVFHLHVHLVPRYALAAGVGALVTHGDPGDLDDVLAEITRDR